MSREWAWLVKRNPRPCRRDAERHPQRPLNHVESEPRTKLLTSVRLSLVRDYCTGGFCTAQRPSITGVKVAGAFTKKSFITSRMIPKS